MKFYCLMASILFLLVRSCSAPVQAQAIFIGTAIVPNNPTSVDNISFVRHSTVPHCYRDPPYHTIFISNNNITIAFGKWAYPDQVTIALGTTRPVDLVDLGRLLPGDYTLTTTTEGPPCPFASTFNPSPPELDKVAFKVTDGRTRAKQISS